MTLRISFLLCFMLLVCPAKGQGVTTVRWESKMIFIDSDKALIDLKALVQPGWHLYSQHIGEGGPLPTRITFESDTAFALLGSTTEQGTPVQFHDDTYGMNITWYSGVVNFQQRIKLLDPNNLIHGQIDYMTCNTQVCVPGHHYFTIPVNKKSK